MASTLKYSTTTVTFDGVIDVAWGRKAMKSEDFGSNTGVSRQAASNRTQGNIQVSFELVTAGGTSVVDKVKTLADEFKASAKQDWTLTLDFGSSRSLVILGKIVAVNGTFQGGTASTKFVGTIDMNIATETWT